MESILKPQVFSGEDTTPRNRTITLYVQAPELYAKAFPPTEAVVDEYTAIENDDGLEAPYRQPKANFETDVYETFEVTWKIKMAEPTTKGYSVALVNVTHNPGPDNPNYFSTNPLYPSGREGNIQGLVKSFNVLPNKDDSYTINFSITGPDGKKTPYPLDPKLKVKPDRQ